MPGARSMAFCWTGGPSLRLMSRAPRFSAAFGINNRGQISGFYVESAVRSTVFSLDKGIFATIDVPGAMSTSALR